MTEYLATGPIHRERQEPGYCKFEVSPALENDEVLETYLRVTAASSLSVLYGYEVEAIQIDRVDDEGPIGG